MTSAATQPRTSYHHGNLVEVLLAAAIALIEERGVEQLSVREVAKRAGVSPGAPFRHFASKTALLTAVAEQAMARLTESVRAALAALGPDGRADPMEGLRAVGRGYLTWALANPTHFQVISSRTLIDFHGSERLVEENEAMRVLVVDLIAAAQAAGGLRPGVDPDSLVFAARGFVYGIARMWIDGHFQEWRVEGPPATAIMAAFDLFITAIGGGPAPS